LNPPVEGDLSETRRAGDQRRLPPASVTNVDKLGKAIESALQKGESIQISHVTTSNRIQWVIRDRDRFQTLVEDLKDFIDGLHGVFPAIQPRHNRLVGRCINSIQEADALQLFLDATEADYPGASCDTVSES
jgi:hypothetical protein